MADPNISEEVHFEMLEKKADGTFKAKYPKVKSKSGVTFDEHLADFMQLNEKVDSLIVTGTKIISETDDFINLGFKPRYVKIMYKDGSSAWMYEVSEDVLSGYAYVHMSDGKHMYIGGNHLKIESNGFSVGSAGRSEINYLAIR